MMSQHCTYNYSQKGFSREKNLSRERAKNTVDNGYHYYGARYYNSNLSMWISVDPLADKYPSHSPYNFVMNNPVMLIDPDGMRVDWVENVDGDIYWDENATSQETTKKGETYLGKNVLVGTHNRGSDGNEELNSAQFDLYLESDKTGPSATIMGNTVPSDMTKSGTLAEGLYSARFGPRYGDKYKDELAIRIYNLDGSDGLPTVNGNPNPNSDGKTLTGILFHMGNNYQTSLFDSKGNAYSCGCQTGGNYPGSHAIHNAFMKVAGENFRGSYYLRSKPPIPGPNNFNPDKHSNSRFY